jgi:hypothetical protein
MAIRDGDKWKAFLSGPLCSVEQRQLAYDFLTRNHEAQRLRSISGWQGSLVEGYASILGLQDEHVAASNVMVIRRSDGSEIPLRPKKVNI